ncbi:hypothetical protein HanIR_Chr06g0266541 [Helianthus annuus]|nr:hypothetical protein HanIR_Chr06g0266541 [Helianthus annuus]
MRDMTEVAYLSQNYILQSRRVARVDTLWQALHLAATEFLPIWWHLYTRKSCITVKI